MPSGGKGPGIAILLGEEGDAPKAKSGKGASKTASKVAAAAAKDLLSALEGKDEVKLARVLDVLMGGGVEDEES
jgi:hypothetical protein